MTGSYAVWWSFDSSSRAIILITAMHDAEYSLFGRGESNAGCHFGVLNDICGIVSLIVRTRGFSYLVAVHCFRQARLMVWHCQAG